MPISKEEMTLRNQIINRAFALDIVWKRARNPRMTLAMDLSYADMDVPLDWKKLLEFDDFTFTHDICGIQGHMNRETEKLEDCFLPRCAKPSKEEQDD